MRIFGQTQVAIDRKDRRQQFFKSRPDSGISCAFWGEDAARPAQDLSEHSIGSAVFGKARITVSSRTAQSRVHVRQLRLKLHEYFDGEGRDETSIVEIRKGPPHSFAPSSRDLPDRRCWLLCAMP